MIYYINKQNFLWKRCSSPSMSDVSSKVPVFSVLSEPMQICATRAELWTHWPRTNGIAPLSIQSATEADARITTSVSHPVWRSSSETHCYLEDSQLQLEHNVNEFIKPLKPKWEAPATATATQSHTRTQEQRTLIVCLGAHRSILTSV